MSHLDFILFNKVPWGESIRKDKVDINIKTEEATKIPKSLWNHLNLGRDVYLSNDNIENSTILSTTVAYRKELDS